MTTTTTMTMTDLQLEKLCTKLASGDEEVTATDLQPLEALHRRPDRRRGSFQDNDPDDVGTTTTGSTTTVPFLDRSFLRFHGVSHPAAASVSSTSSDNNHTTTTTTSNVQLVRYVGMVQDMLDPEFYIPTTTNGKSTHFRDDLSPFGDDPEDVANAVSNDIDEKASWHHRYQNSSNPTLAERIPLVIVPIPFASDWLVRQVVSGNNDHNLDNRASTTSKVVASPTSVVATGAVVAAAAGAGEVQAAARKRGREEEEEDDDDDDVVVNEDVDAMNDDDDCNGPCTTKSKMGTPAETEPMDCGGGDDIDTMMVDDWWPAGTCGTPQDHCPVLAKFNYDQFEEIHQGCHTQGDMADDDVSPITTTTTIERLRLNDVVSIVGVLSMNPWEADFSGGPTSNDNRNDDAGTAAATALNGQWDDYGSLFAPRVPPPSRLPRIHVLSYKRINLDEIGGGPVDDGDTAALSPTEQSSLSVYSHIPSIFTDLVGRDDPLLSPALWMCLLSKAERKTVKQHPPERGMIRAGPMERALGCVSLHLSTPDLASSRALFHHLGQVLPRVCPVVAKVEIGLNGTSGTAGGDAPAVPGPTKGENGRLFPSPWQLPAGAVLLVHYHKNSAGGDDVASSVLQELVQHHRLPYQFEGGVIIPFEADYRIIVVTTQTQKIPPCTMSLPVKLPSGGIRQGLGGNDCVSIKALRDLLSQGLACPAGDGLILTLSLLERAQQDFLERRRQGHDGSTQQVVPDEDTFHSWLTLARIQARSRCIGQMSTRDDTTSTKKWEAIVEDWERALAVIDAVQVRAK